MLSGFTWQPSIIRLGTCARSLRRHSAKMQFLRRIVLAIGILIESSNSDPVNPETRFLQQNSCSTTDDCESYQFCGTDGVCYDWGNCQNWYYYGDVNFTGNLLGPNAPALNCSDVDRNEIIYYASVYGCNSFPTFAADAEPYGLRFTRRCYALRSDLEFTCYELLATTNFTEYTERTSNSSGYDCTESDTPYYQYYIINSVVDQPPVFEILGPNPGDSVDSFNQTEALYALSSWLQVVQTSPVSAPEPVGTPASTSPIATPSRSPIATPSRTSASLLMRLDFTSFIGGICLQLLVA